MPSVNPATTIAIVWKKLMVNIFAVNAKPSYGIYALILRNYPAKHVLEALFKI